MTQVQWWQIVMYDRATGLIPPDGVQSVTQEMLQDLDMEPGRDFIVHDGAARSDTHKVDLTQTPPGVVAYTPPVLLDREKAKAKKRVDLKAAKLRSWVGSHGYGQEMVYLAKETEARACLADQNPDAANYPMMAAEVNITGADLHAVATAVVATANGWKQLAASIEQARLGTKKQIEEAETAEAVTAVENAANGLIPYEY